jgi:hypothetical protein
LLDRELEVSTAQSETEDALASVPQNEDSPPARETRRQRRRRIRYGAQVSKTVALKL